MTNPHQLIVKYNKLYSDNYYNGFIGNVISEIGKARCLHHNDALFA